MCTVSSIVLLIGHNLVFISFTISLEIHHINYKTITVVTHAKNERGQSYHNQGDWVKITEGTIVDTRAYQPYTLVGPLA